MELRMRLNNWLLFSSQNLYYSLQFLRFPKYDMHKHLKVMYSHTHCLRLRRLKCTNRNCHHCLWQCLYATDLSECHWKVSSWRFRRHPRNCLGILFLHSLRSGYYEPSFCRSYHRKYYIHSYEYLFGKRRYHNHYPL